MNWQKQGRIFNPDEFDLPWMDTYSWVPTIDFLSKDIARIYFGGRTKSNYTQTGYFEYDFSEKQVLKVSKEPVIQLGPLGAFDDSLALACSIVRKGGKKYLYYVGWMKGNRVRYYPSVGLSISEDGGETFKKASIAPIIPKSNEDPYGMASPFVLFSKEKGMWEMWYASYRRWDLRGEEPWPHYELRHAQSTDGISWELSNVKCIGGVEFEAVARPYVLLEDGIYKMWYSIRERFGTYRIGYAESSNGLDWEVFKDAGIEPSQNGWDSEMVEYPCVFDWNGDRFMLYNGNSHGKTGIGLAILTK